MYTTCAFCNSRLRGDGGPSGLGVGRRLAYDESRGRLWVICGSCARWNLTPFDDRLERIEAVARAAREGQVQASSAQVSLISWRSYEFIRVGQPLRMELVDWRYGERLRARERERARVVVPLTIAAVGIGVAANVWAGGSFGFFIWNFGRVAEAVYVESLGWRRVRLGEPPDCAACGSEMRLRARHLRHGRLVRDTHADLALLIECPKCGNEGALLAGADAAQALRRGLTFLNARRGVSGHAEQAAQEVDRRGGPLELIQQLSRRDPELGQLHAASRLALEIAVDEVSELRDLEHQWREAEELAGIADGMLSGDPALDAQLDRLKQRARQGKPSQPDS